MEYNPLKITVQKPDKENVVLFLWLCTSLFLAVTRFLLSRIGIESGILREAILLFITCVPFIYLFIGSGINKRKTISKDAMTFVAIFALVVIVFLLSLVFNPELSQFYFRKDYGIGPVFRPDGAIYAFLLFSLVDDPKELKRVMLKAAYVMFVFQVVVVFLPAMMRGYWIDIAPNGSEMHVRYSLSFGYDMLFPLMVFLTEGLERHSIVHYVLAAVSMLLIITNGGRGALVVLMVFLVLLVVIRIIDQRTTAFKKIVLIVAIGIVLTGCYFLLDDIIAALINFLTNRNISSRSLEMFMNGSFSSSNGRDRIWNAVKEAILHEGPFGYGMFGDRPFVVPIHIAGYSHNLFLELLASFGVIGAGVIVYIISDAVRMILFCKDEDWRRVYVVLFSCACKLMLSFSFWYSWEFWAAAAVAKNYRNLQKKKRYTHGESV